MNEVLDVKGDIEAEIPVSEAGALAVRGSDESAVATIPEGPGALLAATLQLARDPTFDTAKLQVMLEMQFRLEDRQAERLFGEALVRVQGKAPRIPKNGVVNLGAGKGSYDFAKWEDMDALIGPLLKEEGFAVTFSEDTCDERGIRWAATWRAFGHAEKNFITLPSDTGAGRNPLQARGSTNSYAKRYLTEDFLKLVREGADDDGKRGGMKFITQEQVEALLAKLKEAGRQEGSFLPRMCTDVRSAEEVEAKDFDRVMNALNEIINARRPKQ